MQVDSLIETMNKITKFTDERDWAQFHTVKNLVTSISIEAAELSETIQWDNPKISEITSDKQLLESMKNELADVMIYCLRLCTILKANPIEIIEDKIKLNKQKYPIEKSKGKSSKYTSFSLE